MKYGRSKKPCPGCKKIKLGRSANDVCDDCAQLLHKAEWMEKELSPSDNEIVISFAKRSHWNKYLFTKAKTGQNLMDIFQRIAEAGSQKTTSQSTEFQLLGKIDGWRSSSDTTYRTMSKLLAEAVQDLRIAVEQALELEYKQGKKDGHNMLIRLADGDLSINDFNKTLENKQ